MIRPQFTLLRFGPGYHQGETDAFVERLLATANGSSASTPVSRAELEALALRPALFGDRYSIQEVDRYIAEAKAWLPEHVPAEPPVVRGEVSERPTFTVGRFREGYDPVDVDAFLDRLYAGLEGRGPALTPEDVRTIAFTPVRIRPGYVVEEVDAFLETAATWL